LRAAAGAAENPSARIAADIAAKIVRFMVIALLLCEYGLVG
jgi:hypothetical protein